MSAHAYIQYADVPDALTESSRQWVDSITREKLVSFDDCPLIGHIDVLNDGRIQVEFAWPKLATLRYALGDWLMHHGIHYMVVM
jgi:hypothetical protein